jgi:hypothetical protein
MRAARAARNLINIGAELIRRSPGDDGLDTRPLFIHVNSHKDVVQKLVNAYVKTLKYIASLSSDHLAHSPPGQGAGLSRPSPAFVLAIRVSRSTVSAGRRTRWPPGRP